jgi:hypothetical protein
MAIQGQDPNFPERKRSAKAARIEEFYRRLIIAPAVTTAEEAYRLLCDILNAVEDEFTGIPYNPDAWATDGRLYPPFEDRRFEEGVPEGGRGYTTRRHVVYFGANGAIEIQTMAGVVEFQKAGADGKGAWG